MNIEILQTSNPKNFRLEDCKAGTIVKAHGKYCIVTDTRIFNVVKVVELETGEIRNFEDNTVVEILTSDDYKLMFYEEV